MRAPRWVVGLTATGLVGTSALVLGGAGSALADSGQAAAATRFNLNARGDGFYFQVDGDEIPASPTNDAGSATASVTTNNSGGSKSFAGAPYYGNTAQTLPGTINGVPNQFGAEQLQIPFSQFPGYVNVNSTGKTQAAEEGQYYRVSAEALPASGKASAYYGAPAALPAPNQQQTATALTQSLGEAVIASAQGTSQGFVAGPLEVGNATALASITQTAGQPATIESKSFGRFSVSGMDFGFNKNGFTYAGQEMSSADAIKSANSALAAANIQLELAPIVEEKTASGGTRYTIGGLKVTTKQASPSGAGTFTFSYIIGRATVSADVAKLGFDTSSGSESAGTERTAVVASTKAVRFGRFAATAKD